MVEDKQKISRQNPLKVRQEWVNIPLQIKETTSQVQHEKVDSIMAEAVEMGIIEEDTTEKKGIENDTTMVGLKEEMKDETNDVSSTLAENGIR